jgi:hypothetical protein
LLVTVSVAGATRSSSISRVRRARGRVRGRAGSGPGFGLNSVRSQERGAIGHPLTRWRAPRTRAGDDVGRFCVGDSAGENACPFHEAI